MEILKVLGILLGSGVISVLITALFTRRSHAETLSLKYITEERAKWREKIKELMVDLSLAVNSPPLNNERLSKIRSTSTYLKLCLNPDKKQVIDSVIIDNINKLCSTPNYEDFKRLEVQISILLKHDWERAKDEAKSTFSAILIFPLFISIIWILFNTILRDTGLYDFLQTIPHISGTYSELALFFIVIIAPFAIWSVCVMPIKQCCLKKKYDKKFNKEFP